MKPMPLLKFYVKHGAQLEALEAKPEASAAKSIALDALDAGVALAKKHAPSLNDEGMLDDLAAALREAFG